MNKKFELGTELAETARSAQAPQSGIKNLAQAFPELDPRLCQTAGFNEAIDFAAVAPGRYRLGLACRRGTQIEARMFDRLVEVV